MKRRAPFAAILVLLSMSGCTTNDPATPQQPVPTGALASRLETIAVAAAERTEGFPARCTAKVFGRTPASATMIAQVTEAYVWLACQQVGGGVSEVFPAAIRLTTPPEVLTARDGDTSDYYRIFPPDVRGWATRGADKLGELTPSMPPA